MNKNSKIFVAGHSGLVGFAILRNLKDLGYHNFVLRTIDELDLLNQEETLAFFEKERPEYVVDAAAKVGGILANDTYRAQFIYENLMIQNNIIHASYMTGVKKLLFLGSSCIYPKHAPQPMKEEYLLTGELEPTNEPYAIAKIAGIKMCESYYRQYGCDFISVMPTNLYGPNDNFNLETSHVLPALIRKFHFGKCLENNDLEAVRNDLNKRPIEKITGKSSREDIFKILQKYGISEGDSKVNITLWGTGKPRREFMYVDDMASACIFVLENLSGKKLYEEWGQSHINIGVGEDITIAELADMVAESIGFKGMINYDATKPDGTDRKLLDVSLLKKIGFRPEISLSDGIDKIYQHYLDGRTVGL